MKKVNEKQYIKRTQKDYSMSLNLPVVFDFERGGLGIKPAARKRWNTKSLLITNLCVNLCMRNERI